MAFLTALLGLLGKGISSIPGAGAAGKLAGQAVTGLGQAGEAAQGLTALLNMLDQGTAGLVSGDQPLEALMKPGVQGGQLAGGQAQKAVIPRGAPSVSAGGGFRTLGLPRSVLRAATAGGQEDLSRLPGPAGRLPSTGRVFPPSDAGRLHGLTQGRGARGLGQTVLDFMASAAQAGDPFQAIEGVQARRGRRELETYLKGQIGSTTDKSEIERLMSALYGQPIQAPPRREIRGIATGPDTIQDYVIHPYSGEPEKPVGKPYTRREGITRAMQDRSTRVKEIRKLFLQMDARQASVFAYRYPDLFGVAMSPYAGESERSFANFIAKMQERGIGGLSMPGHGTGSPTEPGPVRDRPSYSPPSLTDRVRGLFGGAGDEAIEKELEQLYGQP